MFYMNITRTFEDVQLFPVDNCRTFHQRRQLRPQGLRKIMNTSILGFLRFPMFFFRKQRYPTPPITEDSHGRTNKQHDERIHLYAFGNGSSLRNTHLRISEIAVRHRTAVLPRDTHPSPSDIRHDRVLEREGMGAKRIPRVSMDHRRDIHGTLSLRVHRKIANVRPHEK